jgi:hypothetical protein
MRTLITGQTGTNKKILARTVRDHILRQRGLSSNRPESNKEVEFYEVESPEWLKTDFLAFITDHNQTDQRQIWRDSLTRILKDVEEKKSKDVVLLLHATCYRDGHFFSPVAWDDLLQFRPDQVVTLIDDVYDLWQRVEDRHNIETHLTLWEILNWRSTEILYSQTLANELRIDNQKFGYSPPKKHKYLFGPSLPFYIMAVKHPVETFSRLLFDRDQRQTVYASFPITRTRESDDRRSDIDSFRMRLRQPDDGREDFGPIVVDPLAIDELRLAAKIVNAEGKEIHNPAWYELRELTKFQEYQKQRWPIADPTVPAPERYSKSPFSDLTQPQIDNIVGWISAQIIDRDHRLVGQCERTVAYRPFYPKYDAEKSFKKVGEPTSEPTGGVSTEIRFALDKRQSVFVFHPRTDYHPQQRDKFFVDSALWKRVRAFPSLDSLSDLPEGDFTGFDELLQVLNSQDVET